MSEADREVWSRLPSVSVVVLNYNTREHLETCFQSLRQLIYPADKLELMLVDNASTDQSVEYMRASFGDVSLVCNDQNHGFCKGNNIGAEKARGELLAFLNPDMRVDQRWLIEAVKPLLVEMEAAAVGSQILSWDGQIIDFAGGGANFYGYGYQIGRGQEADAGFDQVKPTLFACAGAMIVRRQIFLEVGGFDEDFFAYYEDVDLGWRLWILGYKVLLAPASITYHLHHGSWKKVGEEKRRVLYERNAFFVMLKNYEASNLNRTLPVALMLLLKRAYLVAGIEDSAFRVGDSQPEKADQHSVSSVGTGRVLKRIKHHLQDSWTILTNRGPAALYLKVKTEIVRYRTYRSRLQIPGRMKVGQEQPHQATIPLQALSYLVAGNDILILYEKMLKKRESIQSRRRRSDREVAVLLEKPFGFAELWPKYQQTQSELTHLFGINKIFET